MAKLISTNPADNYSVLGEVKVTSVSEIKKKVALARKGKLASDKSPFALFKTLCWRP